MYIYIKINIKYNKFNILAMKCRYYILFFKSEGNYISVIISYFEKNYVYD